MDHKELRVSRTHMRAIAIVLSLAGALLVSPGNAQSWPFCHWWLYHMGNPEPLRTTQLVELRARCKNHGLRKLWPRDLFSLDDDSSSQDSGPWLINKALNETGDLKRAYEHALVSRVQTILGVRIDTLELWEISWDVDFGKYPPLDVQRPRRERLLMRSR
jgi:hypothetical protein